MPGNPKTCLIHIYCHGCSEAGGADRAIYHTPPACSATPGSPPPAEPLEEKEIAILREELNRWRGRWQSCLAHKGSLVSYEYECPLCSLLKVLHEGYETSLANAQDESRPAAYRTMMEHFAEAGRQFIEYTERITVSTFDSGIVSRGSSENRQPATKK